MTQQFFNHYRDVPAGWWRWPNFGAWEIASKREGELLVDTDAMDKLQALRDRLGKPIVVVSAYRSPAHNKAVGGAENSYHMRGMAFDIVMANHNPRDFEEAAKAVGFKGFGYYPKRGFMHIDTGPTRSWGTPFPVTDTGTPPEVRPAPTAAKTVDFWAKTGTAIVATVTAAAESLSRLEAGPQTYALVGIGLVFAWLAVSQFRSGRE